LGQGISNLAGSFVPAFPVAVLSTVVHLILNPVEEHLYLR